MKVDVKISADDPRPPNTSLRAMLTISCHLACDDYETSHEICHDILSKDDEIEDEFRAVLVRILKKQHYHDRFRWIGMCVPE